MTTRKIDHSHVDDLDRQLRDLRDASVGLGSDDDFDRLFKIIHQPGWTTPQEVYLINALADAAQRAVEDVQWLRKALLDDAIAISEASGDYCS